MSDVQMAKARAALRTAISELWLLENAVPKRDKDAQHDQIEVMKTAVKKGCLFGVLPSKPWIQMYGDFAVPTDPVSKVSSNVVLFSGNYLNVIIAGALFTTFVRKPARISALLACNAFATLAPKSMYEDFLNILRTHFSSSFLKTFPATKLQYATVWKAQFFLALAQLFSRHGRRGFLIGSVLSCAHAALLARPGDAALAPGAERVIAIDNNWIDIVKPAARGLNPFKKRGKVAVLGDISGSMDSTKMDLLRKAFRDLVTQSKQERWALVLAKWDSWIEFHEVKADAEASSEDWISSLSARGGNDMRHAIEQCMQEFPDVDTCYVMCDGDVSPFEINGSITDCLTNVPKPSRARDESNASSYSGTDWATFRARWPGTTFHFIAFGSGADADRMRQMTEIGGGNFTKMV